jgi:hypothetical protein
MSLDYSELDDGIRDVVVRLNEQGFQTTDSGDGSKHDKMEGALPFLHVFCVVDEIDLLLLEADRMFRLWPDWIVEASYSPNDGVGVLLLRKD